MTPSPLLKMDIGSSCWRLAANFRVSKDHQMQGGITYAGMESWLVPAILLGYFFFLPDSLVVVLSAPERLLLR
jgi:hypothetical protein